MRSRRVRLQAASVLLGVALVGCGDDPTTGGAGGPATGEVIERTGTITDEAVCRVLRTADGQTLALLGPKVQRLLPGQRVEVAGQFGEATKCMISGIRVERFRRVD